MRLVILGCESFIARHVQAAALKSGVETLALPFDADASEIVRQTDTVVNFALNPAYKNLPYDESFDCDLRVARIAARAGARSIIVSSRKVYPESARWNAVEESPSSGDTSHYGRNKAATEARVQALAGARVAIFRLSNICGYEYDPLQMRPTFFGIMQRSLKKENVIRFDMDPSTRRDFLPVEHCARALIDALKAGVVGVYNLGCGVPVRCGDVASWIQIGFGGGELVVDPPVVRDEFFLNTDKWMSRFGYRPVEVMELQSYCVELGQKLKCEKF